MYQMCELITANSTINYASWAATGGTLILAVATVYINLKGDKYTRVILDKERNKFYKASYDFLKEIYPTVGTEEELPGQKITTREYIDNFFQTLKAEELYLNYFDRRKFDKYVNLAENLAVAFDNKNLKKVEKVRNYILSELKKISVKIGNLSDFKNFRENMK